MKLNYKSEEELNKIGVYKIRNLTNNKCYVGSTKKSFKSRYQSHLDKLKTNNHKAYPHLQASVNLYGIANFEFSILEICDKENCIERERYWIHELDSCNREKGYNINPNPSETCSNVDVVKKKISETLKLKYRTGQIKHNSGEFKKGHIPWHKGKKYKSTDHLKVPKKKKGSRASFIKHMKEKERPIEVYNSKNELIGVFRYCEDLINESKNVDSIICKNMILRNKAGRNGYPPHLLQRFNIQKSCNKGILYKGLRFKYQVHLKSDELLEKPEEVNQQPSQEYTFGRFNDYLSNKDCLITGSSYK